ncbi:uncharacterized protein BT62DRAFT_929656 [Guyanagaster necrorhizus]|uniref:Uncharacterized protein n=1 Tax=Guyanagaster necrorhizus TaxID=856835 RepID=A0A9P7VXJ3_9AGAR|nr:uncharacterized protein BT62DRAFT_929656 [Guyanagaster necrorhizus MCA 3950]KAG7448570.1 hypothetical protein BT62DRAFT_929656 [Guyanagaster necrorhizus MCA 3950]
MSATESAASSSASTNSGPMSNGANYFFGFLITFVAILFIFIGCGIAMRRRYQRRRGTVFNLDDLQAMPGLFGSRQQLLGEKPIMWEPWVEKHDDYSWSTIQPLSASRSNRPCPKSIPRPAPIRLPSRNPTAIHGLSLPTWAPADSEIEKEVPSPEESVPSTLQISVLISMPGPPSPDNPTFIEYQIGVARLPWEEWMAS